MAVWFFKIARQQTPWKEAEQESRKRRIKGGQKKGLDAGFSLKVSRGRQQWKGGWGLNRLV